MIKIVISQNYIAFLFLNFLKKRKNIMSKQRWKLIGQIEECPKCNKLMQRREHSEIPSKQFYYTEWDYCEDCNHVQHYNKYLIGFPKKQKVSNKFKIIIRRLQ